MPYIGHIPYDPASDPRQYLTQALQQFGESSLARRQKEQFQKGLSPTMTPMQLLQKALQSGYPMREAMGVARMAPTAKSLSPSQQLANRKAERKLTTINQLEAIPPEQRTKQQQAKLDKMLEGLTSKEPFTQGRIQQTLGELEAGGAQNIFGETIEFSNHEAATDHILRRLGPKWKQLAPEAVEIIDRKWPEKEEKIKIGQIVFNPDTGKRIKWNGKRWVPIQ